MTSIEYKKITEDLIETFNIAGKKSIELFEKGLKIEIKKDNSPVSNGDLIVNDLLSKKYKNLHPIFQ